MGILKKIILCFVTLFVWSASSHEDNSSSSQKLIEIINFQYKSLEQLEPTLLRKNLARVLIVKKSIDVINESITENRESGRSSITFQTMRLIQNLIIQYRFSQNFFGWTDPPSIFSIYTPNTEDLLGSLKTSYQDLQKVFGYDDSPYTKITANTFRQMKKLLDELEQLPINKELKVFLRTLWPSIGHTIAIAEQGDRPCAFAAASSVVKAIRGKYGLLNAETRSSSGFNMVMELTGLTEFYAEFAQVDNQQEIGSCKQ